MTRKTIRTLTVSSTQQPAASTQVCSPSRFSKAYTPLSATSTSNTRREEE
jgi:hypothetical protein